jgi:hypothetical protein
MAKQNEVESLFPALPESLSELSDDDLGSLLTEHEVAADLIDKEDEDFTSGFAGDELLAQYEIGVTQIETIRAEQELRVEAQQEYLSKKAELAERRKVRAESEGEGDEDGGEGDGDEGDGEEAAPEEAAAESTKLADEKDEAEEEEVVEEETKEVVVAAAAATTTTAPRKLRRPPSPSRERMAAVSSQGAPLVAAAGLQEVRGGTVMDRKSLAQAYKITATRRGKPSKSSSGVEERILVAAAHFPFPEDRVLVAGDYEENAAKIAAKIPNYIPGLNGRLRGEALVASGGLCAPLEPIYTMPNFASTARPVRDALPSFQADRGGVNVPAVTYIADIDTAITVIEEADDALGGTFATKSCQDMDCPAYTEVPVTIISHCREYGNLNAMAWPEKIAHENDLTMAAHARTSDQYLLDRIKALSINVTQAAVGSQMNAFASIVHAITKGAAGIRFRLRADTGTRFRALFPAWIGDMLAADNALMEFDRYQAQAQLTAALERYGVSVSYFLDDVTGGTSQGFSAESAGALDDFPDDVQYALYVEGSFIHIDSGSLELGLVRDSTLNSTNDFQLFGESFENVARLGPTQGALWITQDVCPNGVFPALGTALTC